MGEVEQKQKQRPSSSRVSRKIMSAREASQGLGSVPPRPSTAKARLRNVKSKTDSRYSLKDGFPSPTPSTVASIKARSSSARTHRLALSREVLRQKVLKASSSKVIYRHVRGERKGTMSADAVMSNNEPKVYYRHEGRGGKEKARISVNAMRANGSVY
ncbi:hypothetical protein TrRE_jg537 [Triparma retinervis]|uniref:Uncharacterized protein n=1 Tax=Triparma retinervis TaxID=2557542 RepID=A0A9W6ZZY0_9STRA|nr:hypothetical protein TrRE_jg537 [Triparma retinervis]